MVVDARAQLDLFDLDDFLALARLVLLLLDLVFVFAEVEDLADRGLGLGGDLDQIEAGLLGALQRLTDRDYAGQLAVGADQADLRQTDFVIDARTFAAGRKVDGWTGY